MHHPPLRFDRRAAARRIASHPLARLVLAALLFVALQVIAGVGGGLLPAAWRGPLLSQALALVAALAAFAFSARVLERRSLAEAGLTLRGALPGAAAGLALGTAMVAAVVGLLALVGGYAVAGASPNGSALLAGTLLFLLVAVAEELVFRGVLFRLLAEGAGPWTALAVTGLLFGGVHLLNPDATLLGALGGALVGVVLGTAYLLGRDLWLAIGIHWGWNLALGPIFGLPVSGRDAGDALLRAEVRGPALWTGGAYGPEAGLAAFLVAAAVGAALLTLAVRRGRMLPPARRRTDVEEK